MSTVLGRDELAEMGLPAFDSVEKLDRGARDTFSKVPFGTPSDVDPLDILERSARHLDQWRAIAGIAEAAEVLRVRNFGDAFARFDEIVRRARLLTRIDPLEVFTSDPAFEVTMKRPRGRFEPTDPFPLLPSPVFLRAVSSLLEFCPIEEIVIVGDGLGLPELAHRCRLSYDWLRAFVRRKSPGEQVTLHIVGRAYAEARLTLDEAAHLLSMPRTDAVAWLEEYGHARDLESIRLSDTERSSAFDVLRSDRISRGGVPSHNPERVARAVIASQRIEGVDARPWLHP